MLIQCTPVNMLKCYHHCRLLLLPTRGIHHCLFNELEFHLLGEKVFYLIVIKTSALIRVFLKIWREEFTLQEITVTLRKKRKKNFTQHLQLHRDIQMMNEPH